MVHVFAVCVCVWVTLTHRQVVTDGNPSTDLCSLDEEACLNQEVFLSLEAIGSLHRTMDEDDDGNIDVTETDEFLKDSQSRQRLEVRGQRFFTSDLHISLEEMWSSWKHSEVYNWTVEQVSDWLVNCVELPQYADVFTSHGLDGRALPRLAVKNTTLMVLVLRITDRGHAHKLHLKALDTVLFGAPAAKQSVIKDILLVCSLLTATAGCWFAVVQKRRSREQLDRLSELGTHLEGLHTAEQTLRELQDRLQQAEDEQRSVQEVKAELQEKLRDHMTSVQLEADRLRELKGSAHSHMTRHKNVDEELEQMRAALRHAERQMTEHHRWAPVDGLERWLQFTHEVELHNYNTQKHSAERQLLQAREGAEKIKRKRTSLFGRSSSLEDINHKILSAKQALGEVTAALRERLIRWRQIEQLTGFSLVNNPGLPALANFLKVDTSFLGLRPPTPTRHFLLSDDLDDMDEDILSHDTLKYAAWQMDRRVSDLWPLSGMADSQSAWKSSALSLLPRKQRIGDSQRDVFLSQSDTDSAHPAAPHSQSQCSVAPKPLPLPLPPFKPLPPPQRGRGFMTSSPLGGSLEKSSSLGELRGEGADLSVLAPPLMSSSYSTQAIYTSSPTDPAHYTPPHGYAPDDSSSNRDADRRREAEPEDRSSNQKETEDREGGAQRKQHASSSLNRMFKRK